MSVLSRAANKLQPGKALLVPKNRFKVADDEWGHLPEYLIPAANKFVHPFYLFPNSAERTMLCINERNPQLFNGKPVLPAFVKHPLNRELTLVESRLSFGTVKDISKWVHRMQKTGQRVAHKVNVHPSVAVQSVRTSKLKSGSPFIKQLQQFLTNNPHISFETLDSELSKLFIFHQRNEVIYLEEIFLYILQKDDLTSSQWQATLKALPKYIGKEIDDVDMLNTLFLQWILTGEKLFEKIDTPALNLLWNVIGSCSESLNQDVIAKLTNGQIQKFFDTYLNSENLKISQHLLETLASRNVMPVLSSIERYLELVTKARLAANSGTAASDRKTGLYMLHPLAPVFATNLTSKMVNSLLPYCIHQSEIFALLDSSFRSKFFTDITSTCMNNFILRIGQLKDSQIDNSLNISALYNKLKLYHNGNVPKECVFSFIIALVANSNFRAVQTIIKEQPVHDMSRVLEVVKNQTSLVDQSGFTEFDKEVLLNYLSKNTKLSS
ncbi:unnamed protein product [Kluyveromyces dobzhanskii CBS 2104]|uniref:ATPase expression protein 1 n=1 Tax=Kluyveromyces dobzhanskii CBS 2104 TaxID=1427455 RepID=A0A0A8LDS4_9SACH|nr:unnamed protein product [Kluyveromyces dobzhanskii CBS 2104]